MLNLRTLRWRNFLSTGNHFTEIDLRGGGTVLVIGENGAGKSSAMDALVFAMYGKPYRKIRKAQLVNSINGSKALVELEFERNGHAYLVRRGIKPNVFEIHRDGEVLDQPARIADHQAELERIMGLDYDAACQTMIVTSRSFVPFMRLTTPERRRFVEDVLDIEFFTRMNRMNKEDLSDLRTELKDARHEREIVGTKLEEGERLRDELEGIVRERETSVREELRELTDEIVRNGAECQRLNLELEKLGKYEKSYITMTDRVREIEEIQRDVRRRTTELTRTNDFYTNNDTCPTCEQELDEGTKREHVDRCAEEIGKLSDSVTSMDDKIADLRMKIGFTEEKRERANEIRRRVTELGTRSDVLGATHRRRTKELERTGDAEKLEETRERLERIREDRNASMRRVDSLVRREAVLLSVSEILSDGGAKTAMVRRYVPIINERVNHYLSEMNFFVDFRLDEEFEETIRSRHRDDFSYESFSAGERDRIDLALLMTWRDIGRSRNSINTSILLFDEVFDSSLDSFGADDMMRLFRGMDETVMVISHTTEMQDRFENVLRFEKRNGFSHMTVE